MKSFAAVEPAGSSDIDGDPDEVLLDERLSRWAMGQIRPRVQTGLVSERSDSLSLG